jgi:hypothetical protein
MRDYGAVSPKFWIGQTGRAMRGNVNAQLVALYLVTSPHANMIGVFYCPVEYIAKDTGLTIEGASKGLRSLIDLDFCRVDEQTEEVFVHSMAAFQIGDSLDAKDKRCIGVERELEKASSSLLKRAFRVRYAGPFNLAFPDQDDTPKTSPIEAPLKPLRSQEQEQDQEQEQELEDSEAKASDGKPSDSTRKERNPEDTAKAELWRTAVSVLAQGGCPNEDQARTFMGKLVKDYLLPAVRDAVAIAVTEQPADAREFLKATCQRIAGERQKPDIARITVPGRAGVDPEILRAQDALKNARPPSAETLARIAQIRQGVPA